MKIILVIFGVIAFLFFLQYMTSMVATENKREKFLDDVQESFEEEPNEKPTSAAKPASASKPASKPASQPKTTAGGEDGTQEQTSKKEDADNDRTFRIKLLDAIDKAFRDVEGANEHKDQKPIVFDKLSDKAKDLKKSDTFDLDVRNFVEKYLAELDKTTEAKPPKFDASQVEKLTELKDSLDGTLKAIRGVLDNMNPYMEASSEPMSKGFEIPWNPVPLSKINEKLTELKSASSPSELTVNPTKKAKSTTKPKSTDEDLVIEGFENVRNYAFF